MEKIAIVTLNGYFNYGNRLQNYALQEVIKSLGYECDTLINTTLLKNKNSNLEIFMKMPFAAKIKVINYKINKNKINKLNNKRSEFFKNFSKEYINETKFKINVNDIKIDEIKEYKYFVAGSDQVWNPNDNTVSEVNFLTFTSREKRLTYAPSFGVSKIPEKFKENYKSWLNNIDNISVREEAGADIVKRLTGKDSIVLVDPTMLLDKEKWLSISKKDKNRPNKKYLLTYFLGDISKVCKKKINELSRRYDLQIVNLANIEEEKYYFNGPSEFIDYINSASLFITDSFHGCVFSLLMETPFIVCNRNGQSKSENMSSRIDTFVKKFDLESRKFENINESEIFDSNYTNSQIILEKEREKAWSYLRSVIK
ncbi:polysaccharide pyruvyl transferase family protein [Clostridium perfringens]